MCPGGNGIAGHFGGRVKGTRIALIGRVRRDKSVIHGVVDLKETLYSR